MNKCLQCSTTFEEAGFHCPNCGFAPSIINGFHAFALEDANDGKSFPRAGFSRLYALEARSFWFKARNRLILWTLDRFFPGAMSMLEIGCGTGFVLDGVSKQRPNMRLWGCDLFFQGLDFAAERLQDRAQFFQMDARRIPFVNEFDVVGAFDVLEHIREDDEALAQIHQALKPGGGLLITVPQHPWMWSRVDELSKHRRRYSVAEIRSKLRRNGFRFVYATSFVSILLPLMFVVRLRKVKTLQQAVGQLNLPGEINAALEAVMHLEILMIRAGVQLPCGGSLMLVGSKVK